MRTIIPVGGKGSRYDCDFPKSLSKLNGSTILDKLLEKDLPNPTLLVRDENRSYFDGYEEKATIHVSHSTYIGCLFDIFMYIREIDYTEDLLIIVGDIVFDFDLGEIIQNLNDLITIPILKCKEFEDVSDSGSVEINDEGIVTNFIEHELVIGSYRELGIYYIPAQYLKYITECCVHHKVSSPGYLIEYAYKIVSVQTHIVTGNWFHINTIEDYQCCLNSLHGS